MGNCQGSFSSEPSGEGTVVKHYEKRKGTADNAQQHSEVSHLAQQTPPPPQHATSLHSNRVYPVIKCDVDINRDNKITCEQVPYICTAPLVLSYNPLCSLTFQVHKTDRESKIACHNLKCVFLECWPNTGS